MPLVDVALGAALVSMRQRFPRPPEKPSDRQDAAALEGRAAGARAIGIELAREARRGAVHRLRCGAPLGVRVADRTPEIGTQVEWQM